MLQDTYSPLVFSRNEDVAAASLLSLHGDNNLYSDKQDIVTNILFEAIVPSIKELISSAHGGFCE